MRAIFADTVIAKSDRTIIVEGNHYFPTEDVEMKYLEASELQTTCPWKGVASYYSVVVGDKKAKDAAWVYPEPKEKASQIKNYVAFWKGVQVVPD
ncbi:MAG: DUF427 domain-containing protein [Bacillota bacterium]|nr:DUF427 domain-containing protein [Bacillota bacterium]MDW7678277.1 DUF427 domain-containing protein [Bacillota bacterium]